MFSNIPNLLSLSRLPLAVALFACISFDLWPAALIVLSIAAFTDWLDGWWARRFHCGTALGRSLDPLTDKVLILGAFIFLIPVRAIASIPPWIVTVVVAREVIVTMLRASVEAAGQKFGADRFGKLKTVLQFAVLAAAFCYMSFRQDIIEAGHDGLAKSGYEILLGAMLVATVGSGMRYAVKAVRHSR